MKAENRFNIALSAEVIRKHELCEDMLWISFRRVVKTCYGYHNTIKNCKGNYVSITENTVTSNKH